MQDRPIRRADDLGKTVESERPLRLVIVDDSQDVIELIRCIMEREMEVDIVADGNDGTEALFAVSETCPDVVLMDCEMPVMKGPVAARLIRRYFPEVRVILMSADDSQEHRKASEESGAFCFLSKSKLASELPYVLTQVQTAALH